MVVKNTKSWGVATAALKSAVRYIAAELGPKGSRVHATSADLKDFNEVKAAVRTEVG
jgi:enoyl-[acyl-carrier-protein] reductase (NADH)